MFLSEKFPLRYGSAPMPFHLFGLLCLGFCSGTVGSAIGIGGGLIIVPVLNLLFDIPIHHAIGASMVCVIATSNGAASSYVRQGLSDIRLGLVLELGAAVGAVTGALLAGWASREMLGGLFAVLLIYAGVGIFRRSGSFHSENNHTQCDQQIAAGRIPSYVPQRIPLGLGVSFASGNVSGLLGVGGGVVNVPLMYLWMGVPFKIATSTSNFMMGVMAAAGAFIYYGRGEVLWWIAGPVATGIFFGARLGTHLLRRVPTKWLQILFSLLALYFAGLMIHRVLMQGWGP